MPTSYARIEDELDHMIDENFNLQEEERKLMTAVKKLQKKKQESIAGASAKVKKLTKTHHGSADNARSRSPTKRNLSHDYSASEFIMDANILRQNLEDSNKRLADAKNEIDFFSRTNMGQMPSEEMISTLQQKELQVTMQKARIQELMDGLRIKETIFKENQAYQNTLVEELKNLNTDYLRL